MKVLLASPLLAFLLATLPLIGCSSNLEPAESTIPASGNLETDLLKKTGQVSVWLTNNQLYIANGSDEDVYFEIFPEEILELIEWAPCDEPEMCKNQLIEPGEETSIPVRQIANRMTTSIVVYFWNLEDSGNDQQFLVTNLSSESLDVTR